jgi:hypothetical protein
VPTAEEPLLSLQPAFDWEQVEQHSSFETCLKAMQTQQRVLFCYISSFTLNIIRLILNPQVANIRLYLNFGIRPTVTSDLNNNLTYLKEKEYKLGIHVN